MILYEVKLKCLSSIIKIFKNSYGNLKKMKKERKPGVSIKLPLLYSYHFLIIF